MAGWNEVMIERVRVGLREGRRVVAVMPRMHGRSRVDELLDLAHDPDNADARPFDFDPDACWRCDARRASTAVGLCSACHTYLTEPVSC